MKLKFDTRKKENQSLYDPMTDLAGDLIEEEDVNYVLELDNGDQVKSSEVIYKKKIDVSKHGNSVSKAEVWQELQAGYSEYIEDILT